MAEVHVHTTSDPKLLGLLHEWFKYWSEQDHMPAKLPDALHIRTAITLTGAGYDMTELLERRPP